MSKEQVVEYSITDANLEELKQKYTTIPDVYTKDGYKEAKESIAVLRTTRTGLEKARKEKNADAIAWKKKVDTEANRIKAVIVSLEEPLKAAKQEVDDKKAAEKAEKEALEVVRINAIKADIEKIKSAVTENFFGVDSKNIRGRILALEKYDPSMEIFEEFFEVAKEAHATTIKKLNLILETVIEEERVAEEVKEQARINAEKEAELAEQQKEIDKANAEKEAELAAKQKELDDKERRIADAERLKKEAEEAQMKLIESERLMKEADAKAAEQKRIEAENKKRLEAESEERCEAERVDREAKIQEIADTLSITTQNSAVASSIACLIVEGKIPHVTFNA